MNLSEEYVIQKFYEHAGYPKFKKVSNVYEAGCPICREGKSWGRKRRAYYLPEDSVICCHNCGWYSSPVKWIMEVAQMTYDEIVVENQSDDYKYTEINLSHTDKPKILNTQEEVLPKDSINLTDDIQVQHYKENNVVQSALKFINNRRLFTGVNKPPALYISLNDFVHKNRLCIPFYDSNNKIIHYQTRGILDKDLRERPKYISKCNSQKSLFNYNNILPAADYIYIFEGPIDAFFVRNSVAVAGIQENSDNTLNNLQKQQLSKKTLSEFIWVLDNQWVDTASYSKTKRLIDNNEAVFLWPESLRRFKDFNEIAVHLGIDEIQENFIQKNVYTGLAAQIVFSKIKSDQP